MEELEDPTERMKETIEALEEKRDEREKWTQQVALSTAIIAVLAAIAGLLGNYHANEAVLDQIKSSDKWSYYQSKSIKSELAASTAQILTALDKPLPPDQADRIAKYEKQKADITAEAQGEENSAREHLHLHIIFARAVTIFQVAIAVSAIAILTRKKLMWYVSIVLAAAGSIFLAMGFL
jgi:Domain of unknown function (DUF4337)